MTVLTTQYQLLKTTGRSRVALLSGMPAVECDDTSSLELAFSPNEEHSFSSTRLLVLELGRPLDVEIVMHLASGDVTVRQDLGGLIVLPLQTTVTVRCPARFGYTLPIAVRAVVG